MPKVSVIVPNYNHAPYLRQRLDSIFNQTFQDFEVIILDDCSTDNSKEVIEQYRSNPKVSHIVYNETNSGSPFKQWAKGFELVQGEYIWIAESDDWAEYSFLNDLVSIIDTDNHISLVFSQSIYEYNDHKENVDFFNQSFAFKGSIFLKEHMLFRNSICNASSVLFKKEKLNQISSNYQSFRGAGDYQFWMEMLLTGNVYYLHKPLNHFRQHIQNTTTQNRSSGNEFFECFKIVSFLRQKNILSFFMEIIIRLHYLKRVELAHKHNELETKTYEKLFKLWGKNRVHVIVSKFIVFTGKFIWNIIGKIKWKAY